MATASQDGQFYRHVVYNEERWAILKDKREIAKKVMAPLYMNGYDPIVYGSIARGDVDEDSDIDVFIEQVVNPALIETIVEKNLGGWINRKVVQATPGYVVKGYIFIDELISISFPLIDMLPVEAEFYSIAGKLNYNDILSGKRTRGMNKSMIVIMPVEDGHMEFPARQDPDLAAKLIGVDPKTLRERLHVLEKRKEHGKTGRFIEVELGEGETFSQVLKTIINENPVLRRRVNK
ncbi:MAG: nucleotidyltransferase domain-containing protein [Nitrososphaerota archaeon]